MKNYFMGSTCEAELK